MTEPGAGAYRGPVMDVTIPTTVSPTPATRTEADRRVRRLLRLPEDGPSASIIGAHSAFSRSIAISAVRCTITYLVLPVLGPIIGASGSVGPVLGLLVGAVSMVAIVAATRRFFAADHAWRWRYATVAVAILALLVVQAAVDIVDLLA